MSAELFLFLLFGGGIFGGVALLMFLMDLLSRYSFDKYLWIPLKFAMREVDYGDGEVRYQLYYKRLLFWHSYTIGIGVDTFINFVGTEEKVKKEIKEIQDRREEAIKFRDNNRWWKHKIKEV